MGTRGAFGFRVNGQDKITYNHFDSYPEGLGFGVLRFIANHSLESLKEIAERIVLVNRNIPPTSEQIEACKPTTNLGVGDQTTSDWYCLLRGAQGNLASFEEVPYMIDIHEFLADSVFCEFAYIINVDTGKLEFYKGFNENPNEAGRYAALFEKQPHRETPKYFGVVLKAEYDLDKFFLDSIISEEVEEEISIGLKKFGFDKPEIDVLLDTRVENVLHKTVENMQKVAYPEDEAA